MTPFQVRDAGAAFTVFVHITFSPTMQFTDTFEPLIVCGNAYGKIHFIKICTGSYVPDSGFIQAPEPGTWALVGPGTVGSFGQEVGEFSTRVPVICKRGPSNVAIPCPDRWTRPILSRDWRRFARF